jgi:hypothetical protein
MFRTMLVTLVGFAVACGGGTDPQIDDVDLAHARWTANRATGYVFELASLSMAGQSPFHRITVDNGLVTAVVGEDGVPVPGLRLTIDSLFHLAFDRRERGELNEASFTRQGVPVMIDFGQWALDGGSRFTVRNFSRIR